MKLLIMTQAVDQNDPVLGFFHRWIEEFSRHCERVHVICLKEGEHSLIGFTALCQSRSSLVLQTKRGVFRHPASVLAPEPALGSLPSVALSSAQADRILLEQEAMRRKIAHVTSRPGCRSWPISDPGETFFSPDRRITNYTTENVLASPAGNGVQTSVPDVVVNGRFWGGHKWPVLRWPPRVRCRS